MRKIYTTPDIEIIIFTSPDTVTASGTTESTTLPKDNGYVNYEELF